MSPVSFPLVLLASHVLANVVWVGALLASALLVGRARFMADAAEVGVLARRVYLRLATPAFVASFVAGLARIAMAPAIYAHLSWMHVKLTFALVLIGIHHVIGARANRVAKGDTAAMGGVGILATAVFACAAVAVFLGVAKSLPWR